MADRGRPKNLTTVLRIAAFNPCMRSKDKENIAAFCTFLEDHGVITFAGAEEYIRQVVRV